MPFIIYAAEPHDADLLANIRVEAMRESLEAVGRFDPERVRERFLQNFVPASTFKLMRGTYVLGFYTLLEQRSHLELDHLCLLPEAQGEGVGTEVLSHVKAMAYVAGKPIHLDAVQHSRANHFYRRNGFRMIHSEDLDNYYELSLEHIEPGTPAFILKRAELADAVQLADLRHDAMKNEWAANGLTDYPLARRHFFEDFKPVDTLKIVRAGELLGFTAVREYADHIHLDMVYLHPRAQGQGVGGQIVANIKEQATQLNKPIRLGALRISNSNKFYQAQGFHFTHNVEFNNYYEYTPKCFVEKPSWHLKPACTNDFNLLADIRQQAMKDNLEANGMFNHTLYQQIFKDSFDPASTWKIVGDNEVLGFYVLWDKQDHLYLERLYFHPKAQGRGVGAGVLNDLKQQAAEQNKSIKLEVLPNSRANAFYLRHGFELVEEREEESIYECRGDGKLQNRCRI